MPIGAGGIPIPLQASTHKDPEGFVFLNTPEAGAGESSILVNSFFKMVGWA